MGTITGDSRSENAYGSAGEDDRATIVLGSDHVGDREIRGVGGGKESGLGGGDGLFRPEAAVGRRSRLQCLAVTAHPGVGRWAGKACTVAS